MCLANKLDLEEKKEFTDKIDRKGIKVYKVVGVKDGEYYPPAKYTLIPYKSGVNLAVETTVFTVEGNSKYTTGFHFYQTKSAAKDFLDYINDLVRDHWEDTSSAARHEGETLHKKHKVIESIVKKSWITTVGRQSSNNLSPLQMVIVAEKAIFPKKEPIEEEQ